MGKRKTILYTLAILVMIPLFCSGCSWTTGKTSKGLAIRCPKCGAFFSSKQGAEAFESMRAEPKETRR